MSIGYFQWTKIGCFRWTRSGSFRRTLTVKHYLKKTGKNIVEATLLPASEILEVAEDFWNE